MTDDEITTPCVRTALADGASRQRAVVAFHAYIEIACREVAAMAGALAVADTTTTLVSLRGLCVALLAAECLELQLDRPAARTVLQRTLDVAVPWIKRVWNAAPDEVERLFQELAEARRSDAVRA